MTDTSERLLIRSIHIPAPSDHSSRAPEMEGSVRTWSVPIADDGTFALTRQTKEAVTPWDSKTSTESVEYDSKLLYVTATGKITKSDRMFKGTQMRDVQISFSATHKTRVIDSHSGEEQPVYRPLTLHSSDVVLPLLPFPLHESPRSDTKPVRHLLILEVP